MILKYLSNPYLNRTEQLAVLMHYARMIDGYDLADLLGVSPSTITSVIHNANRSQKYFTGKRVGNHTGTKMYFLAPHGCKVVSDIIKKKVVYYEFAAQSGAHYRGINMILFRLIKKLGIDQAKHTIHWMNTPETESYLRQRFYDVCKMLGKDDAYYRENVKHLIFPDAILVINGVCVYVEYDNDTVGTNQMKEKMLGYYNLFDTIYLDPTESRPMVLWVTPHPKRTAELKDIWNEVNNSTIKMGFYTQGAETPILSALVPSQTRKNIS